MSAAAPAPAGEIHEQAVEPCHPHVREPLRRALQQLHPLVREKSACFCSLIRHGDDDLVEEFGRSIEDIEVTVGDRVEAAGVDGAFHPAERGEGAAAREGKLLLSVLQAGDRSHGRRTRRVAQRWRSDGAAKAGRKRRAHSEKSAAANQMNDPATGTAAAVPARRHR